jgi:hypothetical protein
MALADRIAELMLQQGNVQANALNTVGAAQAQAAERIGQIQGHAQEQQGQIWGQTLQNLGQIPGQVFGQIQEQKKQQAELQTRALENQQRQLQIQQAQQVLAGQQAGQHLQATLQKNPDGTMDLSGLPSNPLYAKMNPDQQKAILDTYKDFNDIQQTQTQQRKIDVGRVADSVLQKAKASGQPLTMFGAGMAISAATPVFKLTPQEIDQLHTSLIAGGDPTQTFMQLRNQSPEFAKKPPVVIPRGGTLATPEGQPLATGQPEPPTEPELALRAAGGDPVKAMGILKPGPPKTPAPPEPGSFPDYVNRYAAGKGKAVPDLTTADIEDARKRYQQADDKTAADVTALTPQALDMAALSYRKTGTMPTLGMGDKTNRQAIMNRAATLTPEDITRIEAGGVDLAASRATYGADTASLKKLQGQRDAIGAFENTASKNIDLFLNTAGKVVDTGSPLANALVRGVSGKVLGSPDQAAYDAARQVAINEVAKITSNPNLSGTLSDSARKEVEAFNPSNATLKQAVAVMRTLKQDMANRRTSLDDAIAQIQGRIKGNSSSTPPPPGTTTPGLSYQDYVKGKQAK